MIMMHLENFAETSSIIFRGTTASDVLWCFEPVGIAVTIAKYCYIYVSGQLFTVHALYVGVSFIVTFGIINTYYSTSGGFLVTGNSFEEHRCYHLWVGTFEQAATTAISFRHQQALSINW